jgi:hypothetical protein
VECCIVHDCGRDSPPNAPFPICVKHIGQVMEFVQYTSRSPLNAMEVERRNRHARQYLSEERGVVYYVRVGELIKIGTTKQALHSRLNVLSPDKQVLATEPGGHPTERRRHLQFRHLRTSGEWFTPAPELWQHIADLREKHGPPPEPATKAAG